MLMIQLTTPIAVDNRIDPNAPYTHAIIAASDDMATIDQCRMKVVVGWIDGDNRFKLGICNGEDWGYIPTMYTIQGADYEALEATQANGEGAGPAYYRAQYQWLIDNGHFPGTIVDVVPTP